MGSCIDCRYSGKNLIMDYVHFQTQYSMGDKVRRLLWCVYSSATIFKPWNLEMKDYACIASDVDCYNAAKVTIGVNARGCVFKDVEPWTVVGGNPAKFLKKRVLAE